VGQILKVQVLQMTRFRLERRGDEIAIRRLNELAFESPAEAKLVDALRQRDACVLSMVAVDNHRIIGHILFTEATVKGPQSQFTALALAPMAVLPEYQGRGIGSALLQKALDSCRELGYEIVVVVGHSGFYSKFGFAPAEPQGIRCEFDVPDDAFMLLELKPGALAGRRGVAVYHEEFRKL